MDKKLLIGLVLALIVIVLAVFTFTSLNNNNEPLNLNISGNQTNVANGTLFSQGQSNNASSDNSQSNNNANANANSQSNNGDSGNELKKQMFTVSENETGQNEGMEPGTYVMYYTENDGPIKVDKIS